MATAGTVQLRAVVDADQPFLLGLFRSTRQEELALLPQTMVAQQFEAQCKHYSTQYPHAEHSVVMAGGAPAGRLYLERQTAGLRIVDLTLAPEFRNQGIGRRIVEGLQREAASLAKPIIGHVERWNPAQRFWQRLGFELTPGNDVYYGILWQSTDQTNIERHACV